MAKKQGSEYILEVPVAPDTNHYYRVVNGRIVKSHEGRVYLTQVQRICQSLGLTPMEGEVAVKVHWAREKRQGDLDGRLKALLDGLQGPKGTTGCYINDRQIANLQVWRTEDPKNPRMIVQVNKL